MSAIKKLIVFVLVIAVVVALERAWLNAIQPDVSKELALAQLNGDEADMRDLRLFEGYKEGANIVAVFVILCAAWIRREKIAERNSSRADGGSARPRRVHSALRPA